MVANIMKGNQRQLRQETDASAYSGGEQPEPKSFIGQVDETMKIGALCETYLHANDPTSLARHVTLI